ncbi:hypothetical protein N9D31_01835 [Oligoflexaceae bacterium]|nr:hypothetical protein [Oligoflexaceae bacterium]
MIKIFAAIIAVTILFSSCSKTSKRSSSVVEYVAKIPKRALELRSFSKKITHDNRGYPKVGFTIPLDLLNEKNPKKSLIPRCMQPLPDELEVGEIRCVKGTPGSVTLTSQHFDQVCYRDLAGEIVRAKSSINLLGCKTSEIHIYAFVPEIRVDTEAR